MSSQVHDLKIAPENLPELFRYLNENVPAWPTRAVERLGGKYHRAQVYRVAKGESRNPLIIETLILLAEEHRHGKRIMEERIRKATAA